MRNEYLKGDESMLLFEIIIREQWDTDLEEMGITSLLDAYEDIKLPVRATKNSSGHDFFAPFGFRLKSGEHVKFPTGIRMLTDRSVWLLVIPRSGLGTKFWLQLDNTVGDIDGDYWESDNEGHIFAKVRNDGREGKEIVVKAGEAFVQGVILPYELTDDDNVTAQRNGGHGSTGK